MKFVKPSEYVKLAKAGGLPMGAVRMYKNGEWFRKIGGAKGWEYVGKQGGAKAKQVVDEAKAKGLPVVMPSAHPEQAAGKAGQQKEGKPAEPAKKQPKVNLGAKVHLERWAKEHPEQFKAAIAHAINVKNPHPMFSSRDIRGKMVNWDLAMMVKVAHEHGLAAPAPLVKPEGWEDMAYADRLKANKELFIKEVVAARNKQHRVMNQADRERIQRMYEGLNDRDLVEKARQYMGVDKQEREAKAKADAEQKAKDIASAGAAEREKVPDGWEDMDYVEQLAANRKLFVEQMIERRKAGWGEKPFDPKNVEDHKKLKDFMADRDENLVLRMENVRNDPAKKRRAEERQAAAEKLLKEIVAKDVLKSPQEKGLAQSGIVGKKSLGDGHINAVQLLEVKKEDGSPGKAIFKPIVGEYGQDVRRGNVPIGEQWKRERLAFMADQVLGLGMVPPVIVKEVDGKLGAMMDFVDGKVWVEADEKVRGKVRLDEWRKLALFDWLICNTDRHGKNWMVNKEGKLWAIDNGLGFPEKKNFGEWEGLRCEPMRILQDQGVGSRVLPAEMLARLTPEAKKSIVDAMKMFNVGGKGIELFEKRWDYIVKHKELPRYRVGAGGFMNPSEDDQSLQRIAR